MYNTATDSSICWIGLNDINTEGTYVWADGSYSHYIHWYSGQPDNNQRSEDCVNTWYSGSWNDALCNATHTCFFCSSNGESFYVRILHARVDTFENVQMNKHYDSLLHF